MIPPARGCAYLIVLLCLPCPSTGADWPMWRADAERSGVTTEQLPDHLQPLWSRTWSPRVQAWDDPLNLDLMTYDRVFEPVTLDGRLFVGFNDRDQLSAFDATTGNELWTFFTDAPVRLPPAAWNGRVFFTSDDGCLYCVNAESGEQLWRFRGAPSEQKAIGNHRLVSAWAARGGPVIRDDTVYFAASIWPMMGTFLYAIDADTGTVKWLNDGTSAQFIKQPHSAPSFAGVAPQGALVATEEYLVVPGGRSVPAVFHRDSGQLKYFEINAGGKGTGGSFVVADNDRFYVHTRRRGTRAFDLDSGLKTAFMPNEPVLADGIVYTAVVEDEQPRVRAFDSSDQMIWEIDADGTGDLILAGDRLYAAGDAGITSIRLPASDTEASVVQTVPVDGQVQRLLASDGKLFAVTLEGSLLAFGESTRATPAAHPHAVTSMEVVPEAAERVTALLNAADSEGYALWFGIADESLLLALAADCPFTQLAIVDPDTRKVAALRRQLDAAGLYGRVTVHCATPSSFQAPRYVANVVFVDGQYAADCRPADISAMYQSVRPYGGTMHLLTNAGSPADAIREMDLEQAEIEVADHSTMVRRVGRLPGSADWTHQYGDVANTVKSNDARVKLPLGVLWFGGSSNMDVLPRHGHGPPEQVVGGRLFIEGMNSLSARDVYTGRVLWKREFEDLGTYDVYYDETYKDTPLNPAYNQVHIPGANGRGTNYIVTDDRVYLVEGARCHVLDPATGETLQEISLPKDDSGEQREWGYIGVYQDLLLAGYGYANYVDRNSLTFDAAGQPTGKRAGFGPKSLDRAASRGLIAFDRQSGEVIWQVDARHSFWHNGIVAGGGRIYCLDRTPELIEAALRRRGRSRADSYRIVAFSAASGDVEWEITDRVFGTWLGYSEKHDLLLQAGAAASDRLYAEIGQGMAVFHGKDGSLNWKNDSLKYAGPCILHNDWIITNANSYTESAGAFHLTDGHRKEVPNPLTGRMEPWKVTRAYGCNNIIASEHMLTFRSGAAGFYDLANDAGTGNFGGFKSGCTSNLVAANGVLNAPDYTRTCSCAYQNQTSLALVHMPELEYWTINPAVSDHTEGGELRHVGINLGAPGDRRGEDGLLWLEYPAVAGPSPLLTVELNEDARLFQHHSSTVDHTSEPWVLASGADNVTDVTVRVTLEREISLTNGLPITHTNDDAEEQETGEVSLDSSDLELVDDKGNQLVGLRFNGVNLRQGAEIRSAWIQFICDEGSSGPTSLIIAAQDSGNAGEFSSDQHDLSARPKTTQEVGWNPIKWKRFGSAGLNERTPDLASLVKAVVDRDDWRPGNSMAFFFSGTGQRTAVAYQQGEPTARLFVDGDEAAAAEDEALPPVAYRVRLLFAAPQDPGSGRRRFDVALQGETVLEDVVIDPAEPAERRVAAHTFDNIMIADELKIGLIPQEGSPVLAGIEIQQMD